MFSKTLKKLRLKKGLTQKQVAQMMNVSEITYMKYESGESEPKYSKMMTALINLEANLNEILGCDDVATEDVLSFNMKRAEILHPEEKECLNQIVEAMLLKHQIETIQKSPAQH